MYQTTAILGPDLISVGPVVAVVVTATGVSVAAVYTAWRRAPQDLQIEYDRALRSQLILPYKTLWSRTLALAKYLESPLLAYYGANESALTARFERLLGTLLPHEDSAKDGLSTVSSRSRYPCETGTNDLWRWTREELTRKTTLTRNPPSSGLKKDDDRGPSKVTSVLHVVR